VERTESYQALRNISNLHHTRNSSMSVWLANENFHFFDGKFLSRSHHDFVEARRIIEFSGE
jgi:hypothetical protein